MLQCAEKHIVISQVEKKEKRVSQAIAKTPDVVE